MMFYLIWGPPGVGKSSLGKAFSTKLGFDFIDLDRLIEQKQSQTITSIFYTQGEGFFRELEFFSLQQIFDGKYVPDQQINHPSQAKKAHLVISLGGGTLCYPKSLALVNQYLFQQKAMLFSLNSPKAQLITQLQKDSSRPLLKDTNKEGLSLKLDRLLEQRKSDYSLGIQVHCDERFDENLHRLYQCFCKAYPKKINADGYQILFKYHQQNELVAYLKSQGQRYFLITDQQVSQYYLQSFQDECASQGIILHCYAMETGERNKNISTVTDIYDFCLAHQIQRNDCLIAFGGGVVGDICGFVAATILRGIRWIQVPTTLLAQVDSSIGGKTGINHQSHKNMIGAFYPPSLVWIDISFLQTLNHQQLKSGDVEAIKHALIWDQALFDLFTDFFRRYDLLYWDQIDQDELVYLLQRSISIKNEIVLLDPKENGLRRLLNLGHTLGHAIESAILDQGGEPIEHGCAVAMGIVAMLKPSMEYGLSMEETQKIIDLFQSLSLDIQWEKWRDQALPYISTDKKTVGKEIFEIYLKGIGNAVMIKQSILILNNQFNS